MQLTFLILALLLTAGSVSIDRTEQVIGRESTVERHHHAASARHLPLKAESTSSDTASVHDSLAGLLMAVIAGFATVLGSLIVFVVPEGPAPRVMTFMLSLASGVMLAASSELFWKGEDIGIMTVLFVVFGFVGTWGVVRFAASFLNSTMKTDLESAEQKLATKVDNGRTALALFTAVTLHNLPEGMAVVFATLQSRNLGLTICFAVALHNIPEGIVIAYTTHAATNSHLRSFLATFLSAIAEPLGAICALLLLRPSLTGAIVGSAVACVAGIMLYISCCELLPDAYALGHPWFILTGLLSGVLCIMATASFVDRSLEF